MLEQSGAVGLFLVEEFRGNPMGEIAAEAVSGNENLREVVNINDETALYAQGNRPKVLPDVQAWGRGADPVHPRARQAFQRERFSATRT